MTSKPAISSSAVTRKGTKALMINIPAATDTLTQAIVAITPIA